MVAKLTRPKPRSRVPITASPDGYAVAAAMLRPLVGVFGGAALAALADPKPSSKAPDDQGEGEAMAADPTLRVILANPGEAIVCTRAEPEDVLAELRARWPIPGQVFKLTGSTECGADRERKHYIIEVRSSGKETA